jgi:quinol monooxygenase YgiN
MSVTAILELQFRPDAVEEGIEAFHRVLVDTRKFPGIESVVVVQDKENPAHVVAVEVWESLEADAAYREWRAGDGAPTELAALLVEPPRLTVGKHLEA